MKHLTRPTRSFIILVVLTLVAAYGALYLARYQKNNIPSYGIEAKSRKAGAETRQSGEVAPTTEWLSYQDSQVPLAFEYPKGWKVTANTSDQNYYTVELTPKNDQGVITVYVSRSGHYALNGLQTKPYTINGHQGRVLGDWVYAVKAGEYYYTFDSTKTTIPPEELPAIISTARFE